VKKLNESKIVIKNNDREYVEYESCVHDILSHELVLSMDTYIQHSNISCLEHSLTVSILSYKICKHLGCEYQSAARGGLLHDFFLYDWHIGKPYRGLHGFKHPGIALQNANKHFILNLVEKDIIQNHMWPMTITPPKYKESYIVSVIDKICSVLEILNLNRQIPLGKHHVLKEYFLLELTQERDKS